MTIHRIISATLRAKGERFETVDRRRAEARLAEIRKTLDPGARLVSIPGGR